MLNSNAWMILYYDTWPNVTMPYGTLIQNINIKLVPTNLGYIPTYLLRLKGR
jgi:hypothetical protein